MALRLCVGPHALQPQKDYSDAALSVARNLATISLSRMIPGDSVTAPEISGACTFQAPAAKNQIEQVDRPRPRIKQGWSRDARKSDDLVQAMPALPCGMAIPFQHRWNQALTLEKTSEPRARKAG